LEDKLADAVGGRPSAKELARAAPGLVLLALISLVIYACSSGGGSGGEKAAAPAGGDKTATWSGEKCSTPLEGQVVARAAFERSGFTAYMPEMLILSRGGALIVRRHFRDGSCGEEPATKQGAAYKAENGTLIRVMRDTVELWDEGDLIAAGRRLK
jgi:hypothetical protein